ncbi:hypothetical protein, partial [Microbacterium barkeri]|uniref:hypothetical protein n=1 Tax=Microbacterium barkeri TaxID=33917 RepID=UPI003F16E698
PAYAPQPAAAPAAPAAAPAPVAAAPAQTNGLTPDQLGKLAQLRAAGIDDATIAAAIGATVEQVTGVPF